MAFDAAGAKAAGYSDAEISGIQNALAAGYSEAEIMAHLSGTPKAPALPGTEAFGGQAPAVPTAPLPMPLRKDMFGNRPVMGAPIAPSPMAAATLGIGALSKLDEKTGMGQPGIMGSPIVPKPNPLNSVENADVTRPAGLLSIPSTARAGEKFQNVMAAAKDVPIDTAPAGDIALRAQEIAGRGASLPKVVKDFLKRATDPEAGPITYEEGRDFASNAGRLSARDSMKANPAMGRQVGLLAQALDSANGEAAAKVGMGEDYQRAMQEYRRASQLKSAVRTAAKVAVPGLLGTGIAYQAVKRGLLEP